MNGERGLNAGAGEGWLQKGSGMGGVEGESTGKDNQNGREHLWDELEI